jgi:uncharacterized protein
MLTPFTFQLLIGIVVGLFVFTFLYTNLKFASRSNEDWFYTIPEKLIGMSVVLNKNLFKKINLTISIFFALSYALIARFNWYEILAFLNSTPFEQTDPVFGRDISFYVFDLPVYALANSTFQSLVFMTLVLSGLTYLLRGELPKIQNIKDFAESLGSIYKRGRIHLGLLILLLFATFAVDIYLNLHKLLLSPGGAVYGATFTDVKVQIPFLWISLILVIAGALFTIIYLSTRKTFSWVVLIFVLYIASGIARPLTAGVVQALIVSPNELEKERPYLQNNIHATRSAYSLNSIEEQSLPAEQTLEAPDIENNQLTIKNVRLWDRQPLLSTFSQIQEIRTYYKFSTITNDRYIVDGELRQIMLSPRELDSNSLPNPSWINKHLVFTRGHGIVAGPVNQVTEEGLPVLFVKDIPTVSDKESLKIENPSIYFGTQTNDYVIVNTKNLELDYPKGDENVYSSYEGEGGVQISTLLRRLLFAAEFRSAKILLSEDITKDSRIQYKRNIMQRVQTLTPFITYDADPYLVIADQKLYWIVDGYTKSPHYPYSQPIIFRDERINYIRNSVKAVVDAYDGNVSFYISDSEDPLIRTAEKIFPNTFKPLDQMPDSQKDHIRYPEDIFTLQSVMYNIYHMKEPQVFYNREDEWEIAAIGDDRGGSGGALAPRHLIMRLPGEAEEEFILMLPFTPRGKDNMSAWLAARNDGDKYGKIISYTFPKDSLVFGPKQIIGRINQNEEISRQISLWDQRGSQVVRGPLLVIPIESSLIYVQPLYMQAENGRIPELKRVIVAYKNNIEMANTLEEGLGVIFGAISRRQPDTGDPLTETVDPAARRLLFQAQQIYEDAMEAQKQGNWSVYGNKINELGSIINQLQN